VHLLEELVESLIRLGCIVQCVSLVRAIEEATTLWIPGRLKTIFLPSSAREVMQWNTSSAWEAYKDRLECCLLPVSNTSLHRPTSWAQTLEKHTQWRSSIDIYSDPVVWLMFQTKEDLDCSTVPKLFVHLSRWCAVPAVPSSMDVEALAY
jgi:hypothetical protein